MIVYFLQFPRATATPNNKGKLPIHYAARQGRTEVCRLLLKSNPDTAFYTTSKVKLPLHYAISEGHQEISKLLLEINPKSIHAVTSKGKIPLHFAARWGHLELIDNLLQMCPDLAHCLDWESNLPIHEAAREGQTEAAKKLIRSYPGGLKQKNIFNEIPLFAAVRFGSKDLVAEMVQWYPESGGMVLREAISTDQVHAWDWDILELCLRGAVSMLDRHDHKPHLSLPETIQLQDDPYSSKHNNHLGEKIQVLHRCDCWNFQSRPKRNASNNSLDTHSSEELEDSGQKSLGTVVPSKKPMLLRKSLSAFATLRRNLGYEAPFPRSTESDSPERTFYPLHAAVECSSSLAIFHRVVTSYGNQVSVADSYGMLPLHIAACHATNSSGIAIMKHLIQLYPNGAFVRDSLNRLPLHLALMNNADARIVKMLIDINKPSGFVTCGTNDRFANSLPLFVATSCNCSLDVVFLLLRDDPGVINEFHRINRISAS